LDCLPTPRARHSFPTRRSSDLHLDREQSAADRTDNRVDGVPGGIEPRNLVGEKFEEIKNAGNDDDPGLAENFERLEIRREDDPIDRKSTRLNSSHRTISYAVFC